MAQHCPALVIPSPSCRSYARHGDIISAAATWSLYTEEEMPAGVTLSLALIRRHEAHDGPLSMRFLPPLSDFAVHGLPDVTYHHSNARPGQLALSMYDQRERPIITISRVPSSSQILFGREAAFLHKSAPRAPSSLFADFVSLCHDVISAFAAAADARHYRHFKISADTGRLYSTYLGSRYHAAAGAFAAGFPHSPPTS